MQKEEYIKLWNSLPNETRKRIDDLLEHIHEVHAWIYSDKEDGELTEEQYSNAIKILESIGRVKL